MPGRGRGRGRGGGRGRGRGRGGSRRGRGFGPRPDSHQDPNAENGEKSLEKKETLDITKNVRPFFTGSVGFDHHFEAQTHNKERYIAGLATLLQNGVQISQNARVRGLAAAWARHDHELANALLLLKKPFGLVEVLKALTLLDSNRRMSHFEKRLKQFTLSNAKVGQQKISKIKMEIKNLQNIRPKRGSASGAVCKHVRRWVQTFSRDELEYYALHFPKGQWKKLADICHLNPKKDFPQLPWFLPFCFGEPAPEGTMVNRCDTVTAENVNALVAEFPLPYSHIKELKSHLTAESKARIAGYTSKLDQVIWDYEDLQCPDTDKVIESRLADGEDVSLPNGKLLERLLTLKMIRENIPARFSHFRRGKKAKARKSDTTKVPFLKDLVHVAENRVKNIKIQLESPVVIMGDASGSMEVSIRTSTIIAGLLSTITAAKLVFFNTETRESPFLPQTVEQVLELAVSTVANGGTTPAASLYPFYRDKEMVKTFIVVTDEEENGLYENESFDTLFKKYHDEVYPARLVFVSFLRNQHSQGQMVSKLTDYKPLQFKLDSSRPDLTKLDSLFGLLSVDSKSFDDQLSEMEEKIRSKDVPGVFKEIFTDMDTT